MRDFQLPGRSAVYSSNGMCATSHPLAAAAAIDILKDGGNAVDAAIGAAVLLGICEPQSTGIGGDCFVLFCPPGEDRVIALNGSGRAPKALCSASLRQKGLEAVSDDSVASVTVPGAVDAFCRLSADWGRNGLESSLEPSIRYAEDGVPVAPRVSFDWSRAADSLKGAARRYYLLDGKSPAPGAIFRAPGQAEVLRRISRDGRSAFYEGEVAEDMVDSLRAVGGVHSLEDFAATRCDYGTPISGHYRGFEILEHPPNGQGAAALLAANIVAQFDLAAMDPFGAERVHLEAEAVKLAMDARDRFVADPDYVERLDHMLSLDTARQLAGLIRPGEAIPDPAAAANAVHKDTVYLCVVDKDLMAVSMIYSVFHSFGSGIASEKFGINFQNRGAGFTLREGHPNEAGGGKRPLHTIIPAMLRVDGEVAMPFGVMGGQYQPAGHLRVMVNMADFGMNPQEAIDGPRSFPETGRLQLERGYGDKVRARLAEIGHVPSVPESPLGGGQAIRIDRKAGVLLGASDPRKDGCAIGY
ncbi:MAG: gamma-glutamyltransferase family protein [Albidovulum sp.]|nr:gamma-glutamyltransferase family protein [Albidovulum sp.]